MKRGSLLVLVACLALHAPPAALAQQRAPPGAQAARTAPAKPPEPAAPPEPSALPYNKGRLRLSEIVGSLAFLRSLCPAAGAAEWPKRMQGLLESEGRSQWRR